MNFSEKINKILCFVLVCMVLMLGRVWYLSVFRHEHYVQQSQKTTTKTCIEHPPRGTIEDRFGIPLAINKIQYNVSICYSNIAQQIPSIQWGKKSNGKKYKQFPRLEYIHNLASYLSQELQINSKEIEDCIHAKAALLPHLPCTIKENISEKQYYRIRMLQKRWPGVLAVQSTKRWYPMDKTGCGVIGYLGNINQTHYLKIAHEIRLLETYFLEKKSGKNPFLPEGFHSPEEAFARVVDLKEKSYTIHALVGKQGVEAFYDEILRGSHGKNVYEIDIKGHVLKKKPESTHSNPGKKITLSISAELQTFSEKLLSAMAGPLGNKKELNETWIKSGAIVAMIPQTGEIVALASYPRFNSNDFIPLNDPVQKKEKAQSIQKWLETDGYLGEIWDGLADLEREYFSFVKGKYIQETLPLTWELFLNTVLSSKSPIKEVMDSINTIFLAVQIQEKGTSHPILQPLPSEEDRFLIIDLCHLIAPKELFSMEILEAVGDCSLQNYHEKKQHLMQTLHFVKNLIKPIFYDLDFLAWRNDHFTPYLKEKRREEKAKKKYTRPYTDYLIAAQSRLLENFWGKYKLLFLYTAITKKIPIDLKQHPHLTPYLQSIRNTPDIDCFFQQQWKNFPPPLAMSYLQTFRSYQELGTPLHCYYPALKSYKGKQVEKHLASSFYPRYGCGFMQSLCYQQPTTLGSIFKLVTAYEFLMQRHQNQQPLNPLTIVDDVAPCYGSNTTKQILGHFLDKTPIYRYYKNGLLPRSSHAGIGLIDLPGAIETSSNVYFAIIAGDYMGNPENLASAAKTFGFGAKTGIDLPGEAAGFIPHDLNENKTNLYSFSIGQHTLGTTPLQTAVALSAIATQGSVVKPFIVKQIEGKKQNRIEIRKTIPLPNEIATILQQGMHRVVTGPKGNGRLGNMKPIYDHPTALQDYAAIHTSLLAKTGTAEVGYKQTIGRKDKSSIKCHGRFGAIAYPRPLTKDNLPPNDPELVVVTFLQFAGSGAKGGPIVGEVVKKWREIQKNHYP